MDWPDYQQMVREPTSCEEYFQHSHRFHPEITREAIRYKLTMLDDEFFATSPDSLRYMGDPRPELDKAWNKLLSIGQ